jgi:hypothetical protein
VLDFHSRDYSAQSDPPPGGRADADAADLEAEADQELADMASVNTPRADGAGAGAYIADGVLQSPSAATAVPALPSVHSVPVPSPVKGAMSFVLPSDPALMMPSSSAAVHGMAGTKASTDDAKSQEKARWQRCPPRS